MGGNAIKNDMWWTTRDIDHRGKNAPDPLPSTMTIDDYYYYEDVDFQFATSVAICKAEKWIEYLELNRDTYDKKDISDLISESKRIILSARNCLSRHKWKELDVSNMETIFESKKERLA